MCVWWGLGGHKTVYLCVFEPCATAPLVARAVWHACFPVLCVSYIHHAACHAVCYSMGGYGAEMFCHDHEQPQQHQVLLSCQQQHTTDQTVQCSWRLGVLELVVLVACSSSQTHLSGQQSSCAHVTRVFVSVLSSGCCWLWGLLLPNQQPAG